MKNIGFFLFLSFILISVFTSLSFAEGTSLTPQGIQFPDGTLQTTKATGIPGPQGPSLGVYSNNGEYLGVVIEVNEYFVTIFIPSIKTFCQLSSLKDNAEYCDVSLLDCEYFETTNCTGTSYISNYKTSPQLITKLGKKHDGSYAQTSLR